MTKIQLTQSLPAVLKADHLFVVGPARLLKANALPDVLPADLARLVVEAAADVRPGPAGSSTTTLTGARPRRLTVGVLPDGGSRHNTPAGTGPIAKVLRDGDLARAERAGLLLVLDDAAHLLGAAVGVARSLPLYSARSEKAPACRLTIAAVDTNGSDLKWTPAVSETLHAVREAARLVDHPPTEMNPEALVREARRLFRGVTGISASTIVGPALLEKGLGGIHAVGRTALKAPRMLVATYTPERPSKHHVALVGKGVTYDTGGLNLKGRAGMSGMKMDMGGAAAVIGAFRVLAASGSPHKVTLVLCAAENAIGPSAYKPDDVLTMHSGKTVEINNTDAEGRLLLGDGVSYASRVLGATVVLDAATLTGAQMVATGMNHAAVVSNDEGLEQLLVDCGRRSGDLTHPLPFAPELYQPEFQSAVADMKNSVKNRANAQSSCAAQFVHSHLDARGGKVRWGHVDMAGPAQSGERATGYGVALLSEAVRRLPRT